VKEQNSVWLPILRWSHDILISRVSCPRYRYSEIDAQGVYALSPRACSFARLVVWLVGSTVFTSNPTERAARTLDSVFARISRIFLFSLTFFPCPISRTKRAAPSNTSTVPCRPSETIGIRHARDHRPHDLRHRCRCSRRLIVLDRTSKLSYSGCKKTRHLS